MGVFKPFMGRAMFKGSDRRRIWPETIKSPDFYDLQTFYDSC
jgi:hypothetical protein